MEGAVVVVAVVAVAAAHMGAHMLTWTSAFCAISSRKSAERSCLALGITTSTSIRSRQSGSGTSFALLSYWPCFGLARAKAMRTRHERNS